MSNFHNLDNEEVIFIYMTNRKFIEQYEGIFSNRGVESAVDLSDNAYVVSFKEMTEQDLLDLLDDPHYKYCLSVEEKLAPIVELIQEELPELYNKVASSFGKVQ
jgi:hypothetical protein